MGVVPALDELEHRHARLDLSVETAAVEQLAFERGEKALAHGIVEAVAYRTHRRPHPSLPAAHPEGDRRVQGRFKRSSQYLDRGNWMTIQKRRSDRSGRAALRSPGR